LEPDGAEILAGRMLAATEEGRHAFFFRYSVPRGRVKIRFRDEAGAEIAFASDVRYERSGVTQRRIDLDLHNGQCFRLVVESNVRKGSEVKLSLLKVQSSWLP